MFGKSKDVLTNVNETNMNLWIAVGSILDSLDGIGEGDLDVTIRFFETKLDAILKAYPNLLSESEKTELDGILLRIKALFGLQVVKTDQRWKDIEINLRNVATRLKERTSRLRDKK